MSEPEGPREGNPPKAGSASRRARNAGVALMAASVLLWASAAVAVFLPLSGGQRFWATSSFLVVGEVFFWISAAVLGRELFRRYRSYLDPRRLLGRRGS